MPRKQRKQITPESTDQSPQGPTLADWVTLDRRYTRSVSLDRDMDSVEALRGYVVTPRAADALGRLAGSLAKGAKSRAFTVTSVYGTGKSAFAHFWTALAAPSGSRLRSDAMQILQSSRAANLASTLKHAIPTRGLVRAATTCRQESASSAVLRALVAGVSRFFPRTKLPPVAVEVLKSASAIERGKQIDPSTIPDLVRRLADAGTGVVLVLDELGKVLEHSARSATGEDLYLLQQLAEITTSPKGYPVVVVGLLHQGFGEYGATLTATERSEWQKIQGRFEDIAYSEAPEYLLSLMRQALSQANAPRAAQDTFKKLGAAWHARLKNETVDSHTTATLSAEAIAEVIPMHPVTALILPVLCAKYAQHDRSLFAFLTSQEPHSLTRFLQLTPAATDSVPLHRLASLYDYFVDSAGQSLTTRPQFQRWAEVHGVVTDARTLEPDYFEALKTIGVLNLSASSGPNRASKSLVLTALTSDPESSSERERWLGVLDNLVAKGLITYRRQLDEYRVWEGSEFDVEQAIARQSRTRSQSLANLMSDLLPLTPVVAQRHSTDSGTLRFFERIYADNAEAFLAPICKSADSDGVLVYWVGLGTPPGEPPSTTKDGRPVVVLVPDESKALRSTAEQLSVLRAILQLPELQADAIARKEVAERIRIAARQLGYASREVLNPTRATVWLAGRSRTVGEAELNSALSVVCDRFYSKSIVVQNELINRRELSSAGARARREVIEAMLRFTDKERLELVGDGPEASLYESVLRRTGIHRQEKGHWSIRPPKAGSGIEPLWDCIEEFCLASRNEARALSGLLAILDLPPYGVKRGIVPLLLAAVLIYHSDDVSVYENGTFIPVLGPEHFERLVKQPETFGVKHFALSGIRAKVFRELENVVVDSGGAGIKHSRNATLLSVVTPLVRFAVKLPAHTVSTKTLSTEAVAVRDALRAARQPDELLFRSLPAAVGLEPFDTDHASDSTRATKYRRQVLIALRELNSCYDRMLERCFLLMQRAFGATGDSAKLRTDLRGRGQYLAGVVLDRTVQAFVNATLNDHATDREWLEALLMVIADKPPQSWSDQDVVAFEIKVSDVARKVANLYALVSDRIAQGRDGFEARRLTITRTDGSEEHRMVWIDEHSRDIIDQLATDALKRVQALPQEQQLAVATLVAERILLTEGEMQESRKQQSTSKKSSKASVA